MRVPGAAERVDLEPSGRIRAADGVSLSARHDPAADRSTELALVVGHGFTGSWRRPETRAVVAALVESCGVVTFDFRGHGDSAGLTTIGRDEVLDVAAAVAWARGLGYRRVVAVGFSMGAAVVVRYAAGPVPGGSLGPGGAEAAAAWTPDVEAAVAVSGPGRWRYRGTRPMRVLHRVVESRAGRRLLAVGRQTRVTTRPWDPAPDPPDAAAARIRVPFLVVHGDADHYFPLDHPRALAAAGAELWIVPGFGHAEGAIGPELTRRIAAWARAAATVPPGASARMRP